MNPVAKLARAVEDGDLSRSEIRNRNLPQFGDEIIASIGVQQRVAATDRLACGFAVNVVIDARIDRESARECRLR